MTTSRPAPTPEGAAITAAQKRARISVRRAAEAAGISEGRWRQIASGYQVVGRGNYVPVSGAPADTIARMAHVVGLTPQDLDATGRRDAATELALMLEADAEPSADTAGPDVERAYGIIRLALEPLTQLDRRRVLQRALTHLVEREYRNTA
ncbi:hypothetical protein GCM10027160_24180 [Streptomyces calidiresistens]|uniref:Uncharacterized protein n=1 Tax=Streptomyces calidiresistens TaxID=1485586 RepID=A0A7W3XYZ8_9ACTN|nr:hypothetical protein [Streptomyces calidiresistens]MBB0232524.1 hypothetical protein [Streptomyces calidiresistens]